MIFLSECFPSCSGIKRAWKRTSLSTCRTIIFWLLICAARPIIQPLSISVVLVLDSGTTSLETSSILGEVKIKLTELEPAIPCFASSTQVALSN